MTRRRWTVLDIFDILGPVMVGPSSSHTAGAVRIGRMARVLLGGEPVKAEIGLYGSFAETGQGHGTDRALVAGLLGMRPNDLKIPYSFTLAGERGLSFHFYTARLRDAHPNTAVVTVEDGEGRRLELQAASTGGGRIRVDRLNGVEVCFTGMFNTLIIRHGDVPGEIADITRELADVRINIANMSLCRDRRGGDVLLVIETDQPVPPVARTLIGELRSVKSMTYYEREEK
jgi:L-serine dehydratase